MKILLIEDDEATVSLLQLALTQQQYTIEVALDGKTGWQLAESIDYDLILLDVMLRFPLVCWMRSCIFKELKMPLWLIFN